MPAYYTLISEPNNGNTPSPQAWKLYGSNDASATGTLLSYVTGQTGWGKSEAKTFSTKSDSSNLGGVPGLIGRWKMRQRASGEYTDSAVGGHQDATAPEAGPPIFLNTGSFSTGGMVLSTSSLAYTGKFDIALGAAKTLGACATLNSFGGAGGSIIGIIDSPSDAWTSSTKFDSIVWAERQTQIWMAGSEGYTRTTDITDAPQETTTADPVCMTLTVGSTHTLHTLLVHCALYSYTAHYTHTLHTLLIHCALYSYTAHSTHTLCTLRIHCAFYSYTVHSTHTL
jgi:hypothetical protein